MARMFRVLAYFCLLVALMAMWGGLEPMALIFFGQTAFFAALSYIGLSERIYLIIFNSYMVLASVVITYYIFFQVPLTGPTH
jgi:hypothetical protein